MKKLKDFKKPLTRQEMKFVVGGFRQCGLDDGFICGPESCPDPYGPYVGHVVSWKCDSPTGACRPTECLYA
ncbi:MAG: hypothetical protein V4520_01290 [Bacteroidota bacterium]